MEFGRITMWFIVAGFLIYLAMVLSPFVALFGDD